MARCVECGQEYEITSTWMNNKNCKDCYEKRISSNSYLAKNRKHSETISHSAYYSTYHTSRTIAQIVSAAGWITVIIGCIALFVSFSIVLSFGIVLSGIFLVMSGQVTRAVVDNADNTAQILSLLKQQISKKE